MRIRETFAAAQVKVFNTPGNFFRIKALTGLVASSLDVRFFKAGVLLNVDLTDSDAGDRAFVHEGFDFVEVTSSVAQDVEMQIARGEVGSDRITGEVSVIEGGKYRTLAGVAFWGSTGVAAVAAMYAYLQLWNPAASGKNLIVNKLLLSTDTPNIAALVGRGNVALASVGAGSPKKLGAAVVPLGEMRSQNSAASLLTSISSFYMTSYSPVQVPLVEPIVVPPGWGLTLGSGAVNQALNASFDWWEELV